MPCLPANVCRGVAIAASVVGAAIWLSAASTSSNLRALAIRYSDNAGVACEYEPAIL